MPLPYDAPLEAYMAEAERLFDTVRQREAGALAFIRAHHPRYRDPGLPWLVRPGEPSDLGPTAFDLDDARLAMARSHDFLDWPALVSYVMAVSDRGSPVYRFESAVEAVISGDETGLAEQLEQDPALVRARSTRVLPKDPPMHRATLLHYVAANGVEGYRQKCPPNAVRIAKMLLDAGAGPDALAQFYGGDCTTMSLLVSSSHPAEAGLHVPLVDLLADYGASIEALGSGPAPLITALIFGHLDAAEALVRRGACVETVVAAAGLGRTERVRELLPASTAEDRHRAMAVASAAGHVETVRLLLDAGEEPDRLNPKGFHEHATPLHQAVANHHRAMVALLVERGARRDIPDTIWKSTAVGWAEYFGNREMAEYLKK